MSRSSAVILVSDPSAETGLSKPMLLHPIMGLPMLSWLAASMAACGCERFFLVCGDRFLEQAAACFPQGSTVTTAEPENFSRPLRAFLSAEGCGESVTVVSGPVLILPRFAFGLHGGQAVSGAKNASPDALLRALDGKLPLDACGEPCTDRDGWCAVPSAESLVDFSPLVRRGVLDRLLQGGVEIWDPANCYVEPGVTVGKGTVLMPGTILRGKTVIGEGCTVGPNTLLENVTVGSGTSVNASQLYDCTVGENTAVGPFAYVRPGSEIGDGCKVGDFVEVKNSVIGNGTKISHLTYVGDSDVGERVNFGCGTVTCNYDRAKKHRTVIGNDCFIGCNTNLVAPVTVGDGAYTAAGSTITEDVPENALAIARSRQTVKPDWAGSHKVKQKK